MKIPSASCLFYLFGDEVDYGETLRRGDVAAAVPASDGMVPLFALERVLMEVAIWDLIRSGAVRTDYNPDVRPPWKDRWRLQKLISVQQPRLLLIPQATHPLPPQHSLCGELRKVILSEGSSAAVAVLDWAAGRWPLPYESVVLVACQEAVGHGIVSSERAADGKSSRRSGYVVGAPRPDRGRLRAIKSAFTEAQSAWDTFYDESPTEALQIAGEVKSSLRSLRPTPLDVGFSPG